MHGIVPVPHKEIEVKLELAQANLPSLNKIPLFQAIESLPRTRDRVGSRSRHHQYRETFTTIVRDRA